MWRRLYLQEMGGCHEYTLRSMWIERDNYRHNTADIVSQADDVRGIAWRSCPGA
jgi:hypothetical protein